MSSIKKFLGLSMVMALAAFAFGASSALASDSLTCQFSGLAGIANPGVEAAGNDVNDNTGPNGYDTITLPQTGIGPVDNLLDRDLGTYTFNGPANCVHVDTDNPGNTGVRTDVTINSSGNYINTICGTGSAFSTGANTTISSPTDADTVTGVSYLIRFVGGVGPLTISNASISDPTTGARSGGTGGGVVNIRPSTGDCATADVTQFAVAGAFTALVL